MNFLIFQLNWLYPWSPLESNPTLSKEVNFSGDIRNNSRINRVALFLWNGINLLFRRLRNSNDVRSFFDRGFKMDSVEFDSKLCTRTPKVRDGDITRQYCFRKCAHWSNMLSVICTQLVDYMRTVLLYLMYLQYTFCANEMSSDEELFIMYWWLKQPEETTKKAKLLKTSASVPQ